jgi:hypothetical protein
MIQLVAQTTAASQAAQATDGVTNIFLLLAVATFAIVLLRLFHVGELGSVLATVGGVIAAVVVITVVALLLFVVLVAFHSLLTF